MLVILIFFTTDLQTVALLLNNSLLELIYFLNNGHIINYENISYIAGIPYARDVNGKEL